MVKQDIDEDVTRIDSQHLFNKDDALSFQENFDIFISQELQF